MIDISLKKKLSWMRFITYIHYSWLKSTRVIECKSKWAIKNVCINLLEWQKQQITRNENTRSHWISFMCECAYLYAFGSLFAIFPSLQNENSKLKYNLWFEFRCKNRVDFFPFSIMGTLDIISSNGRNNLWYTKHMRWGEKKQVIQKLQWYACIKPVFRSGAIL